MDTESAPRTELGVLTTRTAVRMRVVRMVSKWGLVGFIVAS